MINPFTQINWSPSEAEIKKFGITILVGFAVISILIIAATFLNGKPAWYPALFLTGIGAVVFALTATMPKLSLPFYHIWFFLAACIGIVVSNLILAMFYYLIFTPFAIGMKMMTGRDPLSLAKQSGRKTFWVPHKYKHSLKSYFKQY